jgi:GC-rich sequence DNA-binding factor
LNVNVLNEINDEFYDCTSIKTRLEKWCTINRVSYKNASISNYLHKFFSPLVRLELIDWLPLIQDDQSSLESFKWHKQLLNFNGDEILLNIEQKNDPSETDLMLIPQIVEKSIVPKLIELAENVYDPFSSSQTKNFSSLISNLIDLYPTINSQSENSKKLFETIVNKIKTCLDRDIFVPLYPRK